MLNTPLSAQRSKTPGPLFGGAPSTPAPASAPDERLPVGVAHGARLRPNVNEPGACGQPPVCVRAVDAGVSPALQLDYLAALERAYVRLVEALALPKPLADHGLGGSNALDLYLYRELPSGLEVVRDPALYGDDRTSGHCRARAAASQQERQATLCVAEAILLGLDAAEGDGVRRALAAYLWSVVGQPTALDAAAFDDAQANPQLCPVTRERDKYSEGAALFYQYADKNLGAGAPGALPLSLVAVSRATSSRGSTRWHNEPDVMDALGQAFSGPQQLSDFVLSFALARAFVGARDDGLRAPELLWLGDAGRVRFDWVVKASSLPRRLAPLRPLEPLGSAYILVELDRVSLSATLGVRAEWEAPVNFRWTLVALDAAGHTLKRYDFAYVENATQVERTIVDYQGADALLIVGTNLGGVALSHPFDPDHQPWEPHGFTVYLAEI